MAARDSRLAQIFREELKKDKGILGAFLSAASERGKERRDVRNILPSSGISGAIAQRIFGKPYRYGASGTGGVRNVGGGSAIADRASTERLTRIDMNSRITAKNSIVLPAMARDMNLMRMNMQKMVKLSGGKPSTKADMFFKRAGDRESMYESQSRKSSILGTAGSAVGSVASAAGGIIGGIGSALGGIGGGLISIMGSVISSVAGILGSVGGAIFRVIGGALSALGPLGIVLAAASGFMIYQIAKSIDFEKLGQDFKKTYNDVVKGIKEFFGIKEGDDQPSITRQFADKLDKFFGTTSFNKILDFFQDLKDDGIHSINKAFIDIKEGFVRHSHAAWTTITNVFNAVGEDMVGIVKYFYGEYGRALELLGIVGMGIAGANILKRAGKFVAGTGAAGAAAGAAGSAGIAGTARAIGSRLPLLAGLAAGTEAYNTLTKSFTNMSESEIKKQIEILKLQESRNPGKSAPGGNLLSVPAELRDKTYTRKQWIEIYEEALRVKQEQANPNRTNMALQNSSQTYSGALSSFNNSQFEEERRRELERKSELDKNKALQRQSRSGTTSTQSWRAGERETGPIKLNAQQSAIADLIHSKFINAGFTEEQAAAAVVNAYAESRLNPAAQNITNKEASYGLFQMNTKGGLGDGHDPEKLKDPNYNIDLMIKAAKGKQGERFRQAQDLTTAIRTFTEDLERPANKVQEGMKRVDVAKNLGMNIDSMSAGNKSEKNEFVDMIEGIFGPVLTALAASLETIIQRPNGSGSAAPAIASPYNNDAFPVLEQREGFYASDTTG